MSSPQRRYDDSDSEGDDFNPAPADMSDDERQRDEASSPIGTRNDARRSSVSREDDDAEVDGDANGDVQSADGHDNKEDEEDEEEPAPRRKARDDDDEEDEDEDDEEDEDDDDEEMPVRALAPARRACYRVCSP